MRKILAFAAVMMFAAVPVMAQQENGQTEEKVAKSQKEARIVFDATTIEMGVFSEDNPVVKGTFTFTNTGTAPLVIHQAIASCGCTVPTFTRMPVKPGEKGSIEVTYNGNGKMPGKFKKSITIRSNAKESTVRLYITGEMTPSEQEEAGSN